MSQIYKSLISGPVPPAVPTQFTADDATIGIPVANNFNLFSRDTTVNNPNGIQTTTDANGSANHYTELTNRAKVTATTSDGAGQTQTIAIFTPTAASAIEFDVSFIGYDAANNEACGGGMEGIARRSGGGTTVIVGTNDTLDESDAGLSTADWDIVTDGTQIQAQFVGVAGRTITWSAVFIYDQTP